jgi:23S rRNA (guanosine2251-2'-O)-methyltransferase
MILIAHDIRSLHNVGAIFRSADAFSVEKLYLTGYTETPPRKEIAKVALGGQDRVAWEKRDDALALVNELKGKGLKVFALDNREGAVNIRSIKGGDVALVLGNEVEGVPDALLKACDGTVEILMPGAKRSLNVAVAAGIALFALSPENG